tara:strand:- start:778 stop:1593 length:816 start_codon:yes stop_codon:yes gene_type:complete
MSKYNDDISDIQLRAEFKSSILASPPVSTDAELATHKHINNTINHKLFDWFISDDNLFFPKLETFNQQGDLLGKSLGTIHACPEEVLAHCFLASNTSQRKHTMQNGFDANKFPNKIITKVNDHHVIHYSCTSLPTPLAARDWLTSRFYIQIDPDKFVLIIRSLQDSEKQPTLISSSSLQTVVRGDITTCFEFERLNHCQTKMTISCRLDLKGSIPKSLANRSLSVQLDMVRETANYFERDNEIDQLVRQEFIEAMPIFEATKKEKMLISRR